MIKLLRDSKFIILLFLLVIVLSVFINQYVWAQLKNQSLDQQNSLQIKINNQKDAKNKIRVLWQKQAELNDKMIKASDNVRDKTEILNAQIKKSIRFVFDKPEVLPTANQKELETAQSELVVSQKSLEDVTQESIQYKIESKNTVDALYLQLGEEQFNRANPDGIKQ